jgi:hypothetical protein
VLLVLGGLCALAYLVENAWQSWSVVHLDASLNATAGLSSTAPAVFAAAAATGRFAGNAFLTLPLLVAGGAVAAVGSLAAATAGSPWTALAVVVAVLAPLAGRLVGRSSADSTHAKGDVEGPGRSYGG